MSPWGKNFLEKVTINPDGTFEAAYWIRRGAPWDWYLRSLTRQSLPTVKS